MLSSLRMTLFQRVPSTQPWSTKGFGILHTWVLGAFVSQKRNCLTSVGASISKTPTSAFQSPKRPYEYEDPTEHGFWYPPYIGPG